MSRTVFTQSEVANIFESFLTKEAIRTINDILIDTQHRTETVVFDRFTLTTNPYGVPKPDFKTEDGLLYANDYLITFLSNKNVESFLYVCISVSNTVTFLVTGVVRDNVLHPVLTIKQFGFDGINGYLYNEVVTSII